MPKSKTKKQNFVFIFLAVILVAFVVLLAMVNSSKQFFNFSKAAPNDVVKVVAVMSDSNSDEYRADDNRGGAYAATTHNWLEQLVKYRNLNFGNWGSWGGYRRSGYEYNWSRSGATTGSALSAGAHQSIGQLVDAGVVTAVFYELGSNDFAWYNQPFKDIYSGSLSGVALDNYISNVINNFSVALDRINQSKKAKIIVSTIPDVTISPTVIASFPDATRRRRVSDAIAKANTGVRSLISQRGLATFDADALAQDLLTKLDAQRNLTIGGEKISFTVPGDEPHHVILSDKIHGGTVMSGYYANAWMKAMNNAFGTQLQLFSDEELLIHAGIRQPTATASPTVTPRPTPTGTPRATIRPTTTPFGTPRTTVTPRPTPTATPRITASPAPAADLLLRYCGTYNSLRGILLRFLSSSQVREWDARCR